MQTSWDNALTLQKSRVAREVRGGGTAPCWSEMEATDMELGYGWSWSQVELAYKSPWFHVQCLQCLL